MVATVECVLIVDFAGFGQTTVDALEEVAALRKKR